MKKTFLIILGTCAAVVLLVALAGMYKFNYLASLPRYDVDGDKIKTESYKTDGQKIRSFLEENFIEKTAPTGKVFCAFETLDAQGPNLYLYVLCEEYYVQDKELVCPTEEARQACFTAKDSTACEEQCSQYEIKSYLVTGSGVSVPVKLTEEYGVFAMWTPQDGSYYTKDIEDTFTGAARRKLGDVDTGRLQAAVIDQAEIHFGIKAAFEVSGEIGGSCQSYTDCGMLPGEYAAMSRCPHQVACIENRCVAGCYDFGDRSEFPRLEVSDPSVVE